MQTSWGPGAAGGIGHAPKTPVSVLPPVAAVPTAKRASHCGAHPVQKAPSSIAPGRVSGSPIVSPVPGASTSSVRLKAQVVFVGWQPPPATGPVTSVEACNAGGIASAKPLTFGAGKLPNAPGSIRPTPTLVLISISTPSLVFERYALKLAPKLVVINPALPLEPTL